MTGAAKDGWLSRQADAWLTNRDVLVIHFCAFGATVLLSCVGFLVWRAIQ